jgi:hypothetical protein
MTSVGWASFGVCSDGLDPNRTDTILEVNGEPAPGEGWFVLITAESAGGAEGPMGAGTCAERSNFSPCP